MTTRSRSGRGAACGGRRAVPGVINRAALAGATAAYDLLFRAGKPYDQAQPKVSVDFKVRDGRVEATVQTLPGNKSRDPINS